MLKVRVHGPKERKVIIWKSTLWKVTFGPVGYEVGTWRRVSAAERRANSGREYLATMREPSARCGNARSRAVTAPAVSGCCVGGPLGDVL
jgi:hypothetical protein